jgi:hypothetical protein
MLPSMKAQASLAHAARAEVRFVPRRGSPLPEALRRSAEALLHEDLSDVRVHVSSAPGRVGAVAFTTGSDIYFAPRRYDPGSPEGLRLLGHELTHVVQQRRGRVQNPHGYGVAVVKDPLLEAEADGMGRALQRAFNTPYARSTSYEQNLPVLTVAYRENVFLFARNDEHAHSAMIDDFELAARADGLSDQGVSTDPRFRQRGTIQSAYFTYDAFWDGGIRRLVVLNASYIGHGPLPWFLAESTPLREKVKAAGGLSLGDLPVIDYVYGYMSQQRLRLDQVRTVDSGGGVITFLFDREDLRFVFQYYKSPAVFERTVSLLAKVKGCKRVAELLSVIGDQRILVVERLELTLNSLDRDALRQYVRRHAQEIERQVDATIDVLAELGVSQGDVSIDNLGMRGDQYVLFDFNGIREASYRTVEEDRKKLAASIKHNSGF